MIKKLTKFLKKISFSNPRCAEIIIFDGTNAHLIREVIPENFTSTIFKTRPVEIHITPRILCNFIVNLKYLKFKSDVISHRTSFNEILWQLLCIYIKSDLSSRSPKAIITFIDNCDKFSWLSKTYRQAPCIAIQNGLRLTCDSYSYSAQEYYCQHLFCFGEREVVDFPKLGYKVDHFYPVGSLALSINWDNKLSSTDSAYDLLIVSCWRGNNSFVQHDEDGMKSMRIMDGLLSEYLKRHDLKIAVILRTERDSDHWVMSEVGMSEEEYFKSIYGDRIEIIDLNLSERNVYPVMRSAEVIIAGFSTTCLLEAYGMGKKILYANFCDTNKYHVDFKPDIVFEGTENSYEYFEARLDALRTISNEDYSREHKATMKYYMSNPLIKSTQNAIRNNLLNLILSEQSSARESA